MNQLIRLIPHGHFCFTIYSQQPKSTKLKNSFRLVDLLLPGWNQLIGLSHQRLEEIFPNILVEIPEVHQRKIPTCSQITLQIQGRWILSTPVATAWRMQQRLPYTLAPPHKKKEITTSDTLWPFSSNLCESKKALKRRLPSDTVQLAHLLRTTSDHHGRLAEGSTRVHSMMTPLVETFQHLSITTSTATADSILSFQPKLVPDSRNAIWKTPFWHCWLQQCHWFKSAGVQRSSNFVFFSATNMKWRCENPLYFIAGIGNQNPPLRFLWYQGITGFHLM